MHTQRKGTALSVDWVMSSSSCCAVYGVCLIPCSSWGCWTWEADQQIAAPLCTRPPWWSWNLGAETAWPRLWTGAGRCAETPATRAASRALLQGAPQHQSICSCHSPLTETTHHYSSLIPPVLLISFSLTQPSPHIFSVYNNDGSIYTKASSHTLFSNTHVNRQMELKWSPFSFRFTISDF